MDRVDEVSVAIEKQDTIALRELCGHYGDEAAISQDIHPVEMALICYCFHKIFLKVNLDGKREHLIPGTIKNLRNGDRSQILTDLKKFDDEHGFFEGNIVEKARIKVAARLHSRGISILQSATTCSIRMSDLMDYVGETREYVHHLRNEGGLTLEDRLNVARNLLGRPK